jgi:hypothetical protein
MIVNAELRLEAGAPVEGLVVRAEKCGATDVAAAGTRMCGEQHV